MIHLDLFSGIGGFARAVDEVWPGSEHIFCDNDKFCQAILKLRYPNSKIYGDIREITQETLWKEDTIISAQDVENKGEQSMVRTAKNVQGRGQQSGERTIWNEGGGTIENGLKGIKREFMPTTEINASVVEKQNQHFSHSTIKKITVTPRGNCINPKPGKLPSKGGFQTITNSSASTVTSPNLQREYVHTKTIDILTGGFPCQPFSQAGKRKGVADDRFLWPEMLRVIRLTQPKWVIAENVRGILTIEGGLVFEQVCLDLEASGYEVQSFIIPAVAVNAPHRRDRLWIVGHSESDGNTKQQKTYFGKNCSRKMRSIEFNIPNSHAPDPRPQHGQPRNSEGVERNVGGKLQERENGFTDQSTKGQGLDGQFGGVRSDQGTDWNQNWLEVATKLCGVDDGLSAELDGYELSKAQHRVQRLKSLGNAIVPQVAVKIMKAIHGTE